MGTKIFRRSYFTVLRVLSFEATKCFHDSATLNIKPIPNTFFKLLQ